MALEGIGGLAVKAAALPKTPTAVKPTASRGPYVQGAGAGADTTPNPMQRFIGIGEAAYNASTSSVAKAPAAPAAAGEAGGSTGGSEKFQQLLAAGKANLGVPYVWGGNRPGAFDCSGFVQYLFKQIGVNLPRVSYQQMAAGKRVDNANLQPGDLLGWDYSDRNPGADHIAIYIGNGQIMHTNTPGKPSRIESLAGKPQNFIASRVL